MRVCIQLPSSDGVVENRGGDLCAIAVRRIGGMLVYGTTRRDDIYIHARSGEEG